MTDTTRMAAAGLAPMLLDDSKGCPGRRLEVRNFVAGICIACERYMRPGDQIEPAAHRRPSGVMDCPNRRSLGTVDGDRGMSSHGEADCAPADRSCVPLTVGGCGETQVSA